MLWNSATRGNYRIARCAQCPEWRDKFEAAPIRAHTIASKHARRHIGHETWVIDLTTLTVENRYQFDALIDLEDDPPF